MSPSRAAPLRTAQRRLDLSLQRLWLGYVSVGGSLSPSDVWAFLDGQREVSDHDHDILVQVLNEHLRASNERPLLRFADELPPGCGQ